MTVPQLVYAPAKLTCSLRITGVRSDGMHLIEAEMVTLDLCDRLEIRANAALDSSGLPDGEDDLVVRALRLVGRSADVRLHKAIPPGAGLGGGSADAAAVLRWAGFADVASAVVLGADVPFCLVGGRAAVSGIGEVIDPLPYEERAYTLLTPPFGCSTPAVYRKWDEMGQPRGTRGNDLEPAALEVEPRLEEFRDRLEQHAGRRARLAGSGSTWFVEGHHIGSGFTTVTTTPASV